ncbi:MAG: aldose 1-epimerase family protein [Spirochaetota bacterium]
MAQYLGKTWNREQLESYVGDMQQVAGARPFLYDDGKAQGVRGVFVETGGGLQLTVLPGRGMDIPEARFRGRPLHMFSGAGVTSPAYYEEPGLGWLRSFFVGLLTTCGITNAGAPSVDRGEPFGLHGRVSNAAAEDLCLTQKWEGDEYLISLRGKMRESRGWLENVSLTREIETGLGRKGFTLRDVVENHGFEPQPLIMLYHFNFGFPLLAPGARVIGPILHTEPRDEQAAADNGVAECLEYPEPVQGYEEKVFFHRLAADDRGNSFVALWNPDTGDGTPLGMALRFNLEELPAFTQWKMPRRGYYVTGLEPGTAPPLGRGVLRERGELPMIQGRDRYPITITFQVLSTPAEAEELRKEARRLTGR